METRKVQQTGGSTFVISLPKQWATKVGIKTGAAVSLLPQPDGTLIIDPLHDAPPLKKKKIDVTNIMGDSLVRCIIAAYLAGYDVLEFKAKRILAEQKKVIREVSYKLMGPEIMEETANSVIVQDLLNPKEISLKKSVRRMFLITNSMHKDAVLALKSSDKDLATDVVQRDDEVDRLYLLVAKQYRGFLRGSRLPDTSETSIDEYHDLRMAASPLERIADHAQRIAKIASKMDHAIPGDMMELIEKASDMSRRILEDSVDALYGPNVDLANQVISKAEEMDMLINRINEAIMNMESRSSVVALRTVADSIDRTADYGTNIAEIAINSAMVVSNGRSLKAN